MVIDSVDFGFSCVVVYLVVCSFVCSWLGVLFAFYAFGLLVLWRILQFWVDWFDLFRLFAVRFRLVVCCWFGCLRAFACALSGSDLWWFADG